MKNILILKSHCQIVLILFITFGIWNCIAGEINLNDNHKEKNSLERVLQSFNCAYLFEFVLKTFDSYALYANKEFNYCPIAVPWDCV